MRTLSDNIYLICHQEKPTEHKTMKKFRKQDSEKYFEEKKPVRLVDTQEYMEMIRTLLEDGQEVSMIVTGNSMRPFLKHGRDKICMKKTDRKLRKGDIVFYRRENGQYVMHRILNAGIKVIRCLATVRLYRNRESVRSRFLLESPKYRCGENGSDRKIFGGDFLNISGFVFVVSGNLGFLFLQRCRI